MGKSNQQDGGDRPPRHWIAEQFAELEPRLLSYVQRMGGPALKADSQTPEDIVHDAFVRLCQQSWPEIEAYATAWLYRTCRNRVIDVLRREGRMSVTRSAADVASVCTTSEPTAEEHVEQGEQLQRIRNQLAALPDRQQELLRLRLHDQLSYRQIADVTGLTASNVGYLLHQALKSLRLSLQQDRA